MRGGHDDEVTPADVVVEILGRIELVHAARWLGDAGIDADHAHAEVGALLGGGAADAADADDDCGGVGKVDDLGAGLAPPGPVALELLRQVKVKTTGEGEDEGHDVDADVVAVYPAHVGHRDRTGHQLGKVEAG